MDIDNDNEELLMSEHQETVMTCDKCGKEGAKIRRLSKSYGQGESLFVIENVPMISCPNCREMHFSTETIQEIDRIRANRQAVAVTRAVPVAVFA